MAPAVMPPSEWVETTCAARDFLRGGVPVGLPQAPACGGRRSGVTSASVGSGQYRSHPHSFHLHYFLSFLNRNMFKPHCPARPALPPGHLPHFTDATLLF